MPTIVDTGARYPGADEREIYRLRGELYDVMRQRDDYRSQLDAERKERRALEWIAEHTEFHPRSLIMATKIATASSVAISLGWDESLPEYE